MKQIVVIGESKAGFFTLRSLLPSNFEITYRKWTSGFKSLALYRKVSSVIFDFSGLDEEKKQLIYKLAASTPAPVYAVINNPEVRDVVILIKKGVANVFNSEGSMVEVAETLKSHQITDEHNYLVKEEDPYLSRITGASRGICELKNDILLYAANDEPVLIIGETGTGKELAAAALHHLSGRNGSFVPYNGGLANDNLRESELFGSEKGAFTDAVNRSGYFEMANKGTLFLDEIGELSLNGQKSLLRAVEYKTFYRLGGGKPVKTDTRIISATNRDLSYLSGGTGFRLDLFYRLSTLIIEAPPLRDRKEDIPVLAEKCLQNEKINCEIAPLAFEKFHDHEWPGNVRELFIVIKRAAIRSRKKKRIEAEDILFFDD